MTAATGSVVDGAAGAARTHRGQRTRERLRDAARAVFAEQGYAGTRVADVVARAGVSHGTFYTYFRNKAAVLDALIDVTADELSSVVEEPWEGPDGSATVEAVIDRFVASFADHADVVRAWLEASAHDQHFRDRLRQVRSGYVERVARTLSPVLSGTPHDPVVAAGALVAMVEGYATRGLLGQDQHRRADVVRTLTTIWVGGLVRLAEEAS